MKHFAALTLSLAFLLALAAPAHAQDFPVIGKLIFGTKLGETASSVEAKCGAASLPINRQWTFEDRDKPMNVWSIEGSINRNKSIKRTKFYFFNDRLTFIELFFRDSSTENYKALRRTLESKYGPDLSKIPSIFGAQSLFGATIDGQLVSIVLKLELSFKEESGARLTMQYIHVALIQAMEKEHLRRKAARAERDL